MNTKFALVVRFTLAVLLAAMTLVTSARPALAFINLVCGPDGRPMIKPDSWPANRSYSFFANKQQVGKLTSDGSGYAPPLSFGESGIEYTVDVEYQGNRATFGTI